MSTYASTPYKGLIQVSKDGTPLALTATDDGEKVLAAIGATADLIGKGRFDVTTYGAKGDGSTDDSAALIAGIAACVAAGGGTVYFPASATPYRILSKITLPTNGIGSAVGSTPSIRFLGDGAAWDGSLTNKSTPIGASTLDLPYAGTGGTADAYGGTGQDAKIFLPGNGSVEITGLTFTDNTSGGTTNPFIVATNATLFAHHNVFQGNAAKSVSTCNQDAIILGGQTGAVGITEANGFQGYGGRIESNLFTRIRRGIWMQAWCNAEIVSDNSFTCLCGGDNTCGAICLNAITAGDSCAGNIIKDNLIETTGYVYGIYVWNMYNCLFSGNGFYDNGDNWLANIRIAGMPGLSSFNTFLGNSHGSAQAAKQIVDYQDSAFGATNQNNYLDSQRGSFSGVNTTPTTLTGDGQYLTSAGPTWPQVQSGSIRPTKLQEQNPTAPIPYVRRILGVVSETTHAVERWVRASNVGAQYGASLDWRIGSYGVGGVGDGYLPKTIVELWLKAAASYNDVPDVKVQQWKASGDSVLYGKLGIGGDPSGALDVTGLAFFRAASSGIGGYHYAAANGYCSESWRTSAGSDRWEIGKDDGDGWSFYGYTGTAGTRLYLKCAGGIGVGGVNSPTAQLHLPAGTAAASTAPLKINAGVVLTTPEAGALEYIDDGTTGHLYFTLHQGTTVTRVQLI